MATEAVIKLTLEEQELLTDLRKVGSGFDNVSKKVEGVEKNTDKLAKSANTAGNVFKGFLTLEMAKKIGAFADNTLRAAESMDNLSLEARDASKAYVDSMDSLKALAQTFTFGIAEAIGPALKQLAIAAKEATEYWSMIFGVDKEAENRNRDKVIAKLNESRALIRTYNAELKSINEKTNGELSESDRKFYTQRKGFVEGQIKHWANAEKIYLSQIQESTEKIKKTEEEAQKAREKGAKSSIAVIEKKTTIGGSSVQSQAVEEKSQELQTLEKLQDDYDQYVLERLNTEAQQREETLDAEEQLAKDVVEIRRRGAYEIDAVLQELHENDLARIEEDKNAELDRQAAIYTGAGKMFGGLSQLAAASAGKNKELAKLSLDLAELEAIANTAAGVTMAYRQGGVAGLFTGIGVAAAGTAQVITIEKQKQKLADGGIIQGASMGDTVEVMANGGEMMLTKSDQISLLGMIRNGAGGATINATFAPQYSRDTPTIDKTRDYNEFARVIKTLQSNPNYGRVSGALV